MGAHRLGVKREKMCAKRVLLDEVPRRCSGFFLDSGAHSLYTLEVISKAHANGYGWYKSPAFKRYVRKYAEFLKKYKDGVDFYANVDVIFHPRLSWEVLKYLENEHGLRPVPVLHYGTPLKWFEKHLDAGYDYIGVGGLGQEVSRWAYYEWADRVYDFLCPGPSRLPVVKTHGFAMTSYALMVRYPWYSVDSASWAKAAGFGTIFVPHKRHGEFTFDVPPYIVACSHRSRAAKYPGQHLHSMRPGEKKVVYEWLEKIGVPAGTMDDKGEPDEWGATSQYNARALANLRFFEALCDWLPEWPWPFRIRPRQAFFPED